MSARRISSCAPSYGEASPFLVECVSSAPPLQEHERAKDESATTRLSPCSFCCSSLLLTMLSRFFRSSGCNLPLHVTPISCTNLTCLKQLHASEVCSYPHPENWDHGPFSGVAAKRMCHPFGLHNAEV
uniref:Uncharacterized protein n=1 Tax=Arundo donax TaxID=35708 RepID=A0A0A8XSR0_ARUDO